MPHKFVRTVRAFFGRAGDSKDGSRFCYAVASTVGIEGQHLVSRCVACDLSEETAKLAQQPRRVAQRGDRVKGRYHSHGGKDMVEKQESRETECRK